MNHYDPRCFPYYSVPVQAYPHYSPYYTTGTRQTPFYYHYYQPIYGQRPFQEVNPQLFMTSAKYMQSLMKDASVLLERMADSKEFAKQLMTNAQESKQKLVEDQIKQTGIGNIPVVSYTPDGLKLVFSKDLDSINCCNLTLTVRWM
ncbi:hypothetical protein [Robertmurraya korlensis]|uniref:hypothetical protein n=1 Tax=Robertmurraya korlensis TaxID=519977 RepID=UPI0008243C31|nr:hypothetical protein [Robertmurraya korlensis]